jgi:hypothetical protein
VTGLLPAYLGSAHGSARTSAGTYFFDFREAGAPLQVVFHLITQRLGCAMPVAQTNPESKQQQQQR